MLPLGEPMLAWSFNHDEEALPGLVEQRDQQMNVSTFETRKNRQDLIQLAEPQCGVNAIADRFEGVIQSIPGVFGKGGME